MRELEKALADIDAIRTQIARDTVFLGYGPATVVATGALALAAATAQAVWLDDPAGHPGPYFVCWFVTALAAVCLIGAEAVARSRRLHLRLANEMLYGAIEQFMPAATAGLLLAFVLFKSAPESLWLLPGLWAVLAGLGMFAAVRSLPRTVSLVGGWYVLSGLGAIVLASPDHGLSPWAMGIPFGVGQMLFAAVLHSTLGGGNGQD